MKFPDIPGWLRTRLMVALVITAALAFGVRFNQLMAEATPDAPPVIPPVATAMGSSSEPSLPLAALEPAAGDDAPVPADGEIEVIKPATGKADAPAATNEGAKTEQPTDWKDSSDSELEYSEINMKLIEDLSKRRAALDAREKELATRAALLQAAERNLEQKYKELNDLRTEVQELLQQQSDEETARIASLVKIYEGMKAKDAARIFDTLDMDVLLQVLGKMSERKSAPVIAAMNPERARSVTIMLAEQKALPTLDDDLFAP